MGTERTSERIVPSKFSVAILAYCGNLTDYVSTKVLLVKNKYERVGPVAGKVEIINGLPENPFDAIQREWGEETGGEPFEFERPPEYKTAIFAQKDGIVDTGFIYAGILTKKAIDTFSKGKQIVEDEDIVEAKLYNIDDVLVILHDWKNQLAHPEINAQTLINIVNNVMVNHDNYFGSGAKNLFTFADFGMDFKITCL